MCGTGPRIEFMPRPGVVRFKVGTRSGRPVGQKSIWLRAGIPQMVSGDHWSGVILRKARPALLSGIGASRKNLAKLIGVAFGPGRGKQGTLWLCWHLRLRPMDGTGGSSVTVKSPKLFVRAEVLRRDPALVLGPPEPSLLQLRT